MTIAEAIKISRKNAGITQEKLSEILCVSKATVSKWEQGRHKPPMDELTQICQKLGDYALPLMKVIVDETGLDELSHKQLCQTILKEDMIHTDPDAADYMQENGSMEEKFLIGCKFLSDTFDEISEIDGKKEQEMNLFLIQAIISRYLDGAENDLQAQMDLYECLQDELDEMNQMFRRMGYKLTNTLKPKDAEDITMAYAEDDGKTDYAECSMVLGKNRQSGVNLQGKREIGNMMSRYAETE